jgi:transposase-like protein
MPGRSHSRQFKLECVRQVATGQKRPAQLCREHNLAESVLLRWRKEYEARGEEAFTEKRASSREEALEVRIAELERFRGKLSLENELLKKGLSKYHSNGGMP